MVTPVLLVMLLVTPRMAFYDDTAVDSKLSIKYGFYKLKYR